MEYEFVALSWRTRNFLDDADYEREKVNLKGKGWEVHQIVAWAQEGKPRRLAGGVCIMRRPKDEPRMWTKAEIRALFQAEWIQACE